jgi:hypothetical protein
MADANKGWIGVDLDGTLAYYDVWRGPDHIGEVIPEMLGRIKRWMSQGILVKIFTARASVPGQIKVVEKWILAQGLPKLEVTNIKDFGMLQLWDDRAVQIIPNTGIRADGNL